MSEKTEDSSAESLETIRAEAKTLLSEIKKCRTQAEEQLKAAEISRRSADEHASYANQAKINTEEHSKATAVFKGKAEADSNSIATNKQKSDEFLATLTRGKADVDADLKAINERRKEVDQSAENIINAAEAGASHLHGIEESTKSTDALLKEIEQNRDVSVDASKAADTGKIKIEQLAGQADGLVKHITATHASSTELSEQIKAILNNAETDKTALAEILKHLEKSDTTAKGYEERIANSLTELAKLIERATGLLPGFASASLAHSFNEAKKRFSTPQKRWLTTFILCIVGLGVVALPSFLTAILGTPPDSWGQLFRVMSLRIPIVIPLVWLAIYAGKHYMLSVRLEEDYAYKEAISKAFEGYKREMEKIPTEDAANPTPLTTLCTNILMAIAERPGRIYEGRQRDMTPAMEALAAAEEFRKKQTATH